MFELRQPVANSRAARLTTPCPVCSARAAMYSVQSIVMSGSHHTARIAQMQLLLPLRHSRYPQAGWLSHVLRPKSCPRKILSVAILACRHLLGCGALAPGPLTEAGSPPPRRMGGADTFDITPYLGDCCDTQDGVTAHCGPSHCAPDDYCGYGPPRWTSYNCCSKYTSPQNCPPAPIPDQ